MEKDGLFEKEIARRSETFGNITHVFSTYEAFRKKDDKKPFIRGINSFQLLNDDSRWWIVTHLLASRNCRNTDSEKISKK